MSGFLAVYYREMLLLWRKLHMHIATLAVSPALFIVVFGFGIRDYQIQEVDYISFLVPGLIAMGSMTHAFALATEINIAQFYLKVFDEIQAAPVSPLAYVLGEALAGVTRGTLSALIVLVIASPLGFELHWGMLLWAGIILNSFFFSCAAVVVAMVVTSHPAQAMVANFVITPMAFLGGTFFPTDRMPDAVQTVLNLLPLTHATRIIRAAALGQPVELFSFLVLAVLGLAGLGLAVWCVRRVSD